MVSVNRMFAEFRRIFRPLNWFRQNIRRKHPITPLADLSGVVDFARLSVAVVSRRPDVNGKLLLSRQEQYQLGKVSNGSRMSLLALSAKAPSFLRSALSDFARPHPDLD
jgi:hypothetical protein